MKERILRKSCEAVKRMTPEERRAMFRAQAISFVYGNVNLDRLEKGLPEIPREEIERLYDETP